MNKKLIAIIAAMLAMALVFAGCGNAPANAPENEPASEPETDEVAGIAEYVSEDGWKLSYNEEKFFLNDMLGDGEVGFNYIGECSGTTGYFVTYHADKMPDEVLYEAVGEVDQRRIERGECAFGAGNYWAHTRIITPENEDPNAGDIIYQEYTAIEHNGGSVLIEYMRHYESDEEQLAAILDAGNDLMNTFELIDHEPQTEYAYCYGTYEHEGNDVNETVTLNEDHTCELTAQDTVEGMWDGVKLYFDEGIEYEYAVEGDDLYVNLYENSAEWVCFHRVGA